MRCGVFSLCCSCHYFLLAAIYDSEFDVGGYFCQRFLTKQAQDSKREEGTMRQSENEKTSRERCDPI